MKILVVDDNKVERRLIAISLKKYDYEIFEAEDGYGALDCLKNEDISIVISDWMMPEMDGIELCQQVRKENRRDGYVYIIMVTSRSEKKDLMAGFEAGVDAYLYKPIDVNVLDMQIKVGIRIIDLEQALIREKEKVAQYAQKMESLARERAEQLIHADRMASLGVMSAGIAHEINNPATFISGNIQTFEKFWTMIRRVLKPFLDQPLFSADEAGRVNNGSDQTISQNTGQKSLNISNLKCLDAVDRERLQFIMDEMPHLLQGVREGTQRIQRIVKGLKSYARQENPSFETADIHPVIESALMLCHPLLKHRVEVVKKYEEKLPKVPCDRQQIEQVLVNLVSNAAYAMKGKKEATLLIETWFTAPHLMIAVEDIGMGLSKETLDKIWNPFYTTKPVGEGTGLGMSISHGIVKKHGGSLTAENGSLGGARFTMALPIDKNEQ